MISWNRIKAFDLFKRSWVIMTSQRQKEVCSLSILVLVIYSAMAQSVIVQQDDSSVVLSNAFVSLRFNTRNADLNGIKFKGTELLKGKNQRAYLMAPDFNMSPSIFKITTQTPNLVDVSFYHEASNHFQYDLHYVLKSNDAGVYCYLVQTHHEGDAPGNQGQTRWGIRSDETLFDYHLVRDSIQGPMPKMADLGDQLQDWTYKMADGSVYTKYNYADYVDGRYVHGMAGTQSGFGMFVIQASHEYLNGGPTKQYQNVHSNPFLINMFNCSHFLSDKRKGDNIITGEWTKLFGPFLLYFNNEKNIESIWEDAKQRAEKEKSQWPYSWLQNQNYPLQRGTVKGVLLIDGKPAAFAHVILAQPGIDWQAQGSKYIYWTQTNSSGAFELKNIRADDYCLYAYGCNSTDDFQQNNVIVDAGKATQLGKLIWTTSKNGELLWQIGKADRKTTGFNLSGHKRDYGLFSLPPADLKFIIDKNNENDWYYAQTKRGSWDIIFEVDKNFTQQSLLTIGIAGSAKNPLLEVWVNGTKAGAYHFGNDASVYRSAVAGGYYFKQLVNFPSSLLEKGVNVISLKLPDVKEGGGIMYDVIKLEAN